MVGGMAIRVCTESTANETEAERARERERDVEREREAERERVGARGVDNGKFKVVTATHRLEHRIHGQNVTHRDVVVTTFPPCITTELE
jgi:hypothetical protein